MYIYICTSFFFFLHLHSQEVRSLSSVSCWDFVLKAQSPLGDSANQCPEDGVCCMGNGVLYVSVGGIGD